MHRLALLAPFALAALLAGCGSSSSSTATNAAATPTSSTTSSAAPASSTTSSVAPASSSGSQLTLDETEFKITPASPKVAKTGTITITVKNAGAITHALAVQTPSGIVKTGDIAPGASATLTVNASKAGHYAFFCPIDGHRASGMQGVLVVGSSASAASTAASSSTSTSTPAPAPSSSSAKAYGY